MISEGDMELVLRQRAGASLGDEQLAAVIRRTMAAAGVDPKKGMTLSDYRAALADADINLQVRLVGEQQLSSTARAGWSAMNMWKHFLPSDTRAFHIGRNPNAGLKS